MLRRLVTGKSLGFSPVSVLCSSGRSSCFIHPLVYLRNFSGPPESLNPSTTFPDRGHSRTPLEAEFESWVQKSSSGLRNWLIWVLSRSGRFKKEAAKASMRRYRSCREGKVEHLNEHREKIEYSDMEGRSFMMVKIGLLLLAFLGISSATLSLTGINYEVVALMAIKINLRDPYNVLENWDINSVDPCSWRMITCAQDGYVSTLGLPSQSLSETLSPSIGNLTNLLSVLLQNNAISGPIPATIGNLEKLQTLDLSNNTFSGEIPSSVGDLKNLNYLRLNNNSLTGSIPESLSNIDGLTLVDLSYNNLSGSPPTILARTFKVIGNPLICGPEA